MTRMRCLKSTPPLVLLLGAALSTNLCAQTPKPGEDVYKETCSVCHATGVDQAPKFGDKAAWAPLIEKGQHVLTAHAWVGVRLMPPRGGNGSLSLEEFARAVAYTVRAAGGEWPDPDAELLARIRAEEQKRAGNLKTQ